MLLRGVQNNDRCMLGLLELLKVAFRAFLRGVVHIILCYVNQQLQEQCTFSPQSLGQVQDEDWSYTEANDNQDAMPRVG